MQLPQQQHNKVGPNAVLIVIPSIWNAHSIKIPRRNLILAQKDLVYIHIPYCRQIQFWSAMLELGSHFESKWLNPTILTEREGHCMKSELSSPEICCSLTLKWTPHCSSSSSYWSKALAAALTPPPRDAICANLCKGPLNHDLNTIVQHHWQRREWFALLYYKVQCWTSRPFAL